MNRRRVSVKQDDPDTKLSKYLSYVCRHGAHKEGLQVFEGRLKVWFCSNQK